MLIGVACKRKTATTQLLDSKDSRVAMFKESRIDPLYCTTRVKFRYQDPEQSLSGTATVRMVRDSAVWVSVSVLFGIEAARLMFYPDRLELSNKLEGSKETYQYRALTDMIGTQVSLPALQALVLGNSPMGTKMPNKQIMVNDTVWQQYLQPILNLALLKSNGKLAALNTTNALTQSRCELSYGQFTQTAMGLFAYKKLVNVTNPKGALVINLEHIRIDFPTERPEMPW
jgi:hypothetical protein